MCEIDAQEEVGSVIFISVLRSALVSAAHSEGALYILARQREDEVALYGRMSKNTSREVNHLKIKV